MKQSAHPLILFILFFWLFLIIPVHFCSASDHGTGSQEYTLKAVCLYNFTQFIRWPDLHDLHRSDPIIIGVVGHSPIEGAIEELQILLQKSNKKNISVVHHGTYSDGVDLSGSHLLFISSSEKKNMRSIITSLKDAPVLTVSDADGFLEAGGMISLVLQKNKVRWEINRKTIDLAGLHISAKLLQLAIRIENNQEKSELLPLQMHREKPWSFFLKALARDTGAFSKNAIT